MQKLKQRGKNSDYPEQILLWRFTEDEIPDWVLDNFQVEIKNGKKNLFFQEATIGYQIYYYSQEGKKTITIDSIEEGGLALSDKGILYLTEKKINLLYRGV